MFRTHFHPVGTGPVFNVTFAPDIGLWMCFVGSFLALFAQQLVLGSPVYAGAFRVKASATQS